MKKLPNDIQAFKLVGYDRVNFIYHLFLQDGNGKTKKATVKKGIWDVHHLNANVIGKWIDVCFHMTKNKKMIVVAFDLERRYAKTYDEAL